MVKIEIVDLQNSVFGFDWLLYREYLIFTLSLYNYVLMSLLNNNLKSLFCVFICMIEVSLSGEKDFE